jgi:hypothetical protein
VTRPSNPEPLVVQRQLVQSQEKKAIGLKARELAKLRENGIQVLVAPVAGSAGPSA